MRASKRKSERVSVETHPDLVEALWRAIHQLEDRADAFARDRTSDLAFPATFAPDWQSLAIEDYAAAAALRQLVSQLQSRSPAGGDPPRRRH
jgi:hypothetical protein